MLSTRLGLRATSALSIQRRDRFAFEPADESHRVGDTALDCDLPKPLEFGTGHRRSTSGTPETLRRTNGERADRGFVVVDRLEVAGDDDVRRRGQCREAAPAA